jgi:hypothetical protein
LCAADATPIHGRVRVDPIYFFAALGSWRRGNRDAAADITCAAPRWRRRARAAFHHDLLIWTIALREYGFIASLVENGVCVDAVDDHHETALGFAIRRCDRGALETLLANGADPTGGLVHAVRRWDLGLIDYFLAAGGNVRRATRCVSLHRTHGAVLRHLLCNGATFPGDIMAMLDERSAIGDGGDSPLPEPATWYR